MKLTKSILSLAALMAVALVINIPAFAQQGVRAEIPFAFEAGGSHFEPGVYTVQHGMSDGIVTLSSPDGRRIMMLGSRGSVSNDMALAFARNEGRRTLAAVWTDANSASYELVKVKKAAAAPRIEIAAR